VAVAADRRGTTEFLIFLIGLIFGVLLCQQGVIA